MLFNKKNKLTMAAGEAISNPPNYTNFIHLGSQKAYATNGRMIAAVPITMTETDKENGIPPMIEPKAWTEAISQSVELCNIELSDTDCRVGNVSVLNPKPLESIFTNPNLIQDHLKAAIRRIEEGGEQVFINLNVNELNKLAKALGTVSIGLTFNSNSYQKGMIVTPTEIDEESLANFGFYVPPPVVEKPDIRRLFNTSEERVANNELDFNANENTVVTITANIDGKEESVTTTIKGIAEALKP